MPDFSCHCPFTASAETIDALAPVVLEHFTEAHPGFELVEINVRDYLVAEERLAPFVEPLDIIGPIETRPLDAADLEDVQRFFDIDGFAGCPEWAACYCMFHHVGGNESPEWPSRSFEQNRADMSERIIAGTTTGVLAYIDGELAGWCNAGARAGFPERAGRDDTSDAEVASVVCFLVSPPYRGHGVARRLLDAACDMLADRGFRSIEGYPPAEATSAQAAYKGTRSLYEEAGFEAVGDTGVMRKTLG